MRHLEAAVDLPAVLNDLSHGCLQIRHPKIRIACAPSRCSVNSSSGASDVSRTIATRVPSRSTANANSGPSAGRRSQAARRCDIAREGRSIELVADPIVEGGGSDQFQRKLVYVALGEALTAPDDDPVGEEIQLIEKRQVQEGPHEGRGAARGDLAAVRLLELAHRVGKLAFEKRRVVSVNLGQGA